MIVFPSCGRAPYKEIGVNPGVELLQLGAEGEELFEEELELLLGVGLGVIAAKDKEKLVKSGVIV
jgi:hypothetical protein